MKNFLRSVSVLCFAAAAAHAADTTFWIEPCTVMKAACDAGDGDLPDPEGRAIDELSKRVAELEATIKALADEKLSSKR